MGFGLAESHFTGLEVLELAAVGVGVGDAGFAAMLASPVFANSRHVRLVEIGLSDVSVERLVESPWWDRLETLVIDDPSTSRAVEAFLGRRGRGGNPERKVDE